MYWSTGVLEYWSTGVLEWEWTGVLAVVTLWARPPAPPRVRPEHSIHGTYIDQGRSVFGYPHNQIINCVTFIKTRQMSES